MLVTNYTREGRNIHCPSHPGSNHVSREDVTDGSTKLMAGSACTMPGCSCPSFRVLDKYNVQFCENCRHSRSKHCG